MKGIWYSDKDGLNEDIRKNKLIYSLLCLQMHILLIKRQ